MRRALVLALIALGSAAAQERSDTVIYNVRTDPITDANTSYLALPEVNDTSASTFLSILCRGGRGEVFLTTKNPLYSQQDDVFGLYPDVIYRVDDRPPYTETNMGSTLVGGQVDRTRLSFPREASDRLLRDVQTGRTRLAVRVLRRDLAPLTYLFSLSGFQTAWARVNACRPRTAARPTTPSSSATTTGSSAEAPKFLQWSFTTCRDTTTGAVRPDLPAGTPHACELVIDTVPNGARPLAAEFRYELEYREGGVTKKVVLDGVDRWTSAGGGTASFRANGSRLVFTLPLNVRRRADRVYTFINVIGSITFDNGTSKRVYEPLPIR